MKLSEFPTGEIGVIAKVVGQGSFRNGFHSALCTVFIGSRSYSQRDQLEMGYSPSRFCDWVGLAMCIYHYDDREIYFMDQITCAKNENK